VTFATQADVEALLLRELSAAEQPYIDGLLERADALILDYLPGVTFDGEVDGEVVTLRGNGTDELWLPGRPVRAVDTVTIDAELLDPTEYTFSRWGPLRRLCGYWGGRDRVIEVAWDYGLASAPPAVVQVAADLARWSFANPGNARQETIGQYSVTYATETFSGVELLPGHRRILGKYKARSTSLLVESANPWWGHGA